MATGATEFIDSTTADVYIDEKWADEVLVARENALIFADNIVDRRYEAQLTSGDVVHVNSVSNLTAQTKTKATNAAIVYETQTETATNITVATWGYQGIAVETIVDAQSYKNQLALYAPKQGYALALQVDDTLAGHPDDFTNAVGVLANELTDDNLLRARQYLDDADASQDNRAIGTSPAQEAGFLKLDRFVHGDYTLIHGDKSSEARDRAYIGEWMGMPIYKSVNVEGSNAAGHDNFMLQRQAIALILQVKPKTWRMFDIDYLVHKVVVEQLYGSAIMRNDHGVFMRGA